MTNTTSRISDSAAGSVPASSPASTAPGPEEAQFIWRVLEQFAFDYCDELFWRIDDGHMRVFVNCNDVFYWGCADAEEITADNIDQLATARKDAQEATGDLCPANWALLWCARVRGLRPQGAIYKHLDEALHPLFDAAGPKREAGFGNHVDH